jgi:tetratricopeptide (TPR) repeat protein/TolB-like protein
VFRHILIVAFLATIGSTQVFAHAGTVLVFPFENQTDDRNLDWIGEGISVLIIERLTSEPGLSVMQREDRLAGFEKIGLPETAIISRATAMKLGWDSGSDYVITGRFVGGADDFSVYARITDLVSSSASPEIKLSGKLEDVIPLTSTLSWQLLKVIVSTTQTPESDFTSRAPLPRSAFENYIRGLLNNDPKRRTEYFENAIRLNPRYSAAIYQLGRQKYLEGDFKTSNQILEKLVPADREYPSAQFVVGVNNYRLGDYVRAAANFTELPQTYNVLVDLGAALSAKGDPAGALSAWEKAAALDPYADEAVFDIGYLSFVRGDFDTAARSFEQTLRLQGRDAEALFLLGRSYERLGKTEDGQKTIALATRLSPRLERWLAQPLPKLERLCVAPNTFSLNDPGAARWTQGRLIRRAKGQELGAWMEFVQSQADSQMYGDAMRELKELMLVYPNSSDAHVLMGQIYERQKNYDQAVVEYDLSIALRPSADSYVLLARAHRAMNHNAQAIRAVDAALRLEPAHPSALALKTELQKVPPPRRREPEGSEF